MTVNLNAVVLTGNLCADPELRHTQGGTAVCGMRVAVNGREKVGEEWRDRADFFDVRVWANQAESCAQYLKRGSPVAVSGYLRLEEWEPKDGGKKRSRVLVVARTVQFLKGRDGGGRESAAFVPDEEFTVPDAEFDSGEGGASEPVPAATPAPAVPDDDIPF